MILDRIIANDDEDAKADLTIDFLVALQVFGKLDPVELDRMFEDAIDRSANPYGAQQLVRTWDIIREKRAAPHSSPRGAWASPAFTKTALAEVTPADVDGLANRAAD